jgi:hypothetical protein
MAGVFADEKHKGAGWESVPHIEWVESPSGRNADENRIDRQIAGKVPQVAVIKKDGTAQAGGCQIAPELA